MAEKRLGRGLDFLIPTKTTQKPETKEDAVTTIPVRLVRKNRFQPREVFDEAKIQELALSIKENGVIQPILVRKEGTKYELVAGERRLKACSLLGLETIPALVLNIPDARLLEFALVENLQRENLNPLEEARAFEMFIQYQGLTHDEISKKIGKHRSYVTNALRLLELPDDIQNEVSRETISSGHARALLGLQTHPEMLDVLAVILKRGLTVRKTEALVRRLTGKETKESRPGVKTKSAKPPHLASLEDKLRELFNVKVDIQPQGSGGRVTFNYHSEKDLARLYALWTADRKEGF